MRYIGYGFLLLFGGAIGYAATPFFPFSELVGTLTGFIAATCLIGVGFLFERFGTRRLILGLFGFIAGILIGWIIKSAVGPALSMLLFPPPMVNGVSSVPPYPWDYFIMGFVWPLVFGYLGSVLALKIEKEPHLLALRKDSSNAKILDTSVIIDGRIADICETGFLEGTFIIPQFVLHELQYVADSADATKRVRGRRGLDILHRLQKMPNFDLRIVYDDFPSIREVDAKLVALAKQISAKVVTNDFNLNKVAGLQGVSVLNINQLAGALRPVALPGEIMRVIVVKEGKEPSQGVSYLDDGTMIVIDDGRRSIGKKVDVVVTSVLQTSAGRMIFAKLRDDHEREQEPYIVAKTG
jgi:uncharacterized protein YacL